MANERTIALNNIELDESYVYMVEHSKTMKTKQLAGRVSVKALFTQKKDFLSHNGNYSTIGKSLLKCLCHELCDLK